MLLSNLVTFTQRVLHILFIKPVDTTRENPTFLWEFCIKTMHNSDLPFSAMIHFASSPCCMNVVWEGLIGLNGNIDFARFSQ